MKKPILSKKEIKFFEEFDLKLNEYALLIVFKDDLTTIGKLNLLDYESYFRENKERYYKFIHSVKFEKFDLLFPEK